MRIKVSNFTIKYNLRAAHIGLETTAAAAARGTRMQTNKLSRPKHILTSDSDLTTAVTLRTRVVTSQLTLLTEPGHCSLSLSLRMLLKLLLLLLWVWGSARQDGPRPTNTSPAPAPGPASRTRHRPGPARQEKKYQGCDQNNFNWHSSISV